MKNTWVRKFVSISIAASLLVVAGLVVGLIAAPPALAIPCNDEEWIGPVWPETGGECKTETGFCCLGDGNGNGGGCDCSDPGCCGGEL